MTAPTQKQIDEFYAAHAIAMTLIAADHWGAAADAAFKLAQDRYDPIGQAEHVEGTRRMNELRTACAVGMYTKASKDMDAATDALVKKIDDGHDYIADRDAFEELATSALLNAGVKPHSHVLRIQAAMDAKAATEKAAAVEAAAQNVDALL